MIHRSTSTTPFFTEGMTLEFAVGYHAAQSVVAAWLSGSSPAEKPGSDWPWHASCLTHPAWLIALFFAAWFHQHRGEGQAVQARVEEGITLCNRAGVCSAGACRRLSCEDGFCSNRVRRRPA